ncbi:MAG TPA: PqqD family protein [Candidatus Omnitrophota bacterium]|nr:PqqD family protein [Candidatus Omnitrophota bacterium]
MSQMISIASKPKILDNVAWRRDGEKEQIIVLSKEGLALPLILNPTAAKIFSLCNGKNSLEDMATELCAEFGMDDFKMLLGDVKEQVEYFINKGIVE